MGWLYMTRSHMAAHTAPKSYLDAQFTYEHPATEAQGMIGLRVLKSRCVGQVYYAAIQPYGADGNKPITAVICLFRWNPNAADGMIFGYKDMGENCGPCEASCPESILDLLEPTQNEYANQWRARCRTLAQLRKRRIPDGALIQFSAPMEFSDGSTQQEFRAYRPGTTFNLIAPSNGKSYRISRLLEREFKIAAEPKVHPTIFPTASAS